MAIGAPNNDRNGSNSGNLHVYSHIGSSWNNVGGNIDGESESD